MVYYILLWEYTNLKNILESSCFWFITSCNLLSCQYDKTKPTCSDLKLADAASFQVLLWQGSTF